MPHPTKGSNAWEHADLENEVRFGHQARHVSLSVPCRAAEQRHHVQSTLLVPRLPGGKVCGCGSRAPLSSRPAAKARLPVSAQVSPCSGWLTPNETLRNLTSEVSLHTAAAGLTPCTNARPVWPCVWGSKPNTSTARRQHTFSFQKRGEDGETSVPILSNASPGSGTQHGGVTGFINVFPFQPALIFSQGMLSPWDKTLQVHIL